MKNENLTKNDIEFYLLNREYINLKGEEKKFVDEHISSEQEFNELKAIVQGVNAVHMEEEELIPDPKIKAHLLKEFDRHRPASGYWLNGISVALFPKEKKFHQKPGVQLIGIAASISLLIGVFLNVGPMNNNDLAQHKSAEEVVAPAEEKAVENELEEMAEEVEGEKIMDETDEETITTISETVATTKEEENLRKESSSDDFVVEQFKDLPIVMEDVIEEESEELANKGEVSKTYYSLDEVATEEISEIEITDNEVASDLIIDGGLAATSVDQSTEPAVAISEETISSTVATGNASVSREAKKNDSPVTGRTLAEDADLIDLLYTAL